MTALFIVNPAAGHGRAGKRWSQARARAASLWPGAAERTTEGPGHVRELAREAARSGVDVLVAVGGDGTLGEVVDGYLAAAPNGAAAKVTTFPAGSGCDFARHSGVPRDPARWIAAVGAGKVRRLDVLRATFRDAAGAPRSRHVLNVAAAGLAGDVAHAVARRGKFLGGMLTYLLEAAVAAATGRARCFRLTVDGRAEPAADYHLVAAANTSTIGGGMRLAPGADAQDGLLELVTVGAVPRARLLRLLPTVYSGGHIGRDGVVLRRARRVELDADAPLPLNLDGDAEGFTPAVFEVLPGVLPFLM